VIPVDPDGLLFTAGALVVAALLSASLTPLARAMAVRGGAVDVPGSDRRVHVQVTPRGGGLAVAVAFVAVGVLAVALNEATSAIMRLDEVDPRHLLVLFGGALVAAVLGFLDDRWELGPRAQFISQFGLAAIPVASGLTISYVANPFGEGDIFFAWPFPALFTIVWVVGMINSINFIDGLDGLSAGVGTIAVLTLGLISVTRLDQPFVALLCAIFAGALLGFLRWNFHPASIFIGTSGVFVMGYVLAVLSILGTAKVAVALLVLGVPIVDTFWIIVRRLANGRSPFSADRGHLHHRLLDLGLTHRGAVLAIYVLCLALAVLSVVLSGTGQLYAFMGAVVAGGIVLAILTRRTSEALEARTYEEPGPSDA
jgi:UDP-GlcNAc:undecaprenyl-phosphate/decaprenyl-phosphate GlcNAc-1-phosphate transferase